MTHRDKRRERLYSIYKGMKRRCYKPNHNAYERYGARGIQVCDEWINSFNSFVEWALCNGYEEDLSLDRIDNYGNYEPDNCRWVTRNEQQRNRRDSIYCTIGSDRKSVAEWSEISGIAPDVLRQRILMGWPEHRMFEPVHHKKRKKKEA